ncbi:hypothetical protein OOT46_13390 [Aquabacterium sp. A7-Y]|uniref:hypothetical protein n=1 Tax=Aquabacterium sp. A7-Y TaxID=1349605 RepID=UPI00223DF205|nr:hypothetical protein [Aquabacterium sp. A7-Y]MCW7538833.1 hypothetical protein [Aquabacterium sp. A7-Y]
MSPSPAPAPAPAPLLKDGFNAATVEGIADGLLSAHPAFDRAGFLAACLDGFESLSLMERVGRVARTMVDFLPPSYPEALQVLHRAMGPAPQDSGESEGIAVFRHASHLQFVAEAGLGDPQASLDALERMTCRFSGEFAIRPFLEQDPVGTLRRMQAWSRHPDWHVRRLASEGSRPLLPWARRVSHLMAEPALTVPLIDPLAADPHEVVRRSAANHLNDLSRLDAALAVRTAAGWLEAGSLHARRSVERGLRTLVKQGHPEALALLGFAPAPDVVLEGLTLDRKRLAVGERLGFSFQLLCPGTTRACVDYAVHYAAARGGQRRKVFKGEVRELRPGHSEAFTFTRDFSPRTTRKLYPGPHRIEVLVNGRTLGEAGFELALG